MADRDRKMVEHIRVVANAALDALESEWIADEDRHDVLASVLDVLADELHDLSEGK